MQRIPLAFLLFTLVFSLTVDAQQRRRGRTGVRTPVSDCAPKIKTIRDCPPEGCGKKGRYDPNLNRRKNIRSDNHRTTLRSIAWIKNRPDPTNFVTQNSSRAEIARLGEGKKITVIAYALVARKGSAESCNCGLTAPKDTDNHIVLVDPALKTPTLAASEDDSMTAEFTPRVRLDHVNFTREKLQALIPPRGKLAVRVTGLLMFDSEHFLGRHLKRHNNWEIHPVLKLEYCSEGQTCSQTSRNWKNLDDL
jgi:hypothetical protein